MLKVKLLCIKIQIFYNLFIRTSLNMKKLITSILLTSIVLFAEETNKTPPFPFPLDARQLILPPLGMTQDRDFTELLGISTTAPVSNGSMYFHADIFSIRPPLYSN